MITIEALLADKMHEECGVFGIFGSPDAAAKTVLGLHQLQHRGQEAAGVVTFDDEQQRFHAHRASGLGGDNFSNAEVIRALIGRSAVGHNRYSTAGKNSDKDSAFLNIQPLYAEMEYGGFALAHNGNLVNIEEIRADLVRKGSIFQSTSDTEIIIQLMARSRKQTVLKRLVEALKQVEGAYSLIALNAHELIGVRDPRGFRPLVLGKLNNAFVLASETCAFDIIGATYMRDVKPGEMISISSEGLKSSMPFEEKPESFCIFEYVYFSRPDSQIRKRSVYHVRQKYGEELATEYPVKADVVIPIPDSGIQAAMGYSRKSGIPFEQGLTRSHYIGRTFIKPVDSARHLGVKLKLNPVKAVIDGKRVVLVDDSLVRGTTSKKIVDMIWAAGAKEIHLMLSCPMIKNPCFFGIDTPQKSELLATRMVVEEMRRYINVTTLGFLSLDGLYRGLELVPSEQRSCCDACLSGNYPVPIKNYVLR